MNLKDKDSIAAVIYIPPYTYKNSIQLLYTDIYRFASNII